MSILYDHITTLRQRFISDHGKEPTILWLGRWDARELARFVAPLLTHTSAGKPLDPMRPSEVLRAARDGAEFGGAKVKVDGRIGRMPLAMCWQNPRSLH